MIKILNLYVDLWKMRYFLLFLWCFSSSSSALGENHLVYFGGGRSQIPTDAMFDNSLGLLIRYSKVAQWKGDFYYRKSIPNAIPTNDKKNIKVFSPDSFQNKIESLKNDIRQGKIHRGEQLLVYLDTHGMIDDNKDFVLTTDFGNANAEALRSLIKLAEEKQIKLGVVGMNCYSGSLLRFKSPNTCIISIAPADKVGFSSDSDAFINHLVFKPGTTNLEEVYLKSRFQKKGFFEPAQPMISTEAGVAVDEALAPLKHGIFYEVDLKNEQRQPLCKNTSLQVATLADKMDGLAQVVKFSYKNFALPFTYQGDGSIVDLQRIQKLQAKLEEFNVLYNQTKKFAHHGTTPVCSKNQFCLRAQDVDVFETFATSDKERGWLSEMKLAPEYAQFKEATKGQEPFYQRMKELSAEIAQEERALYDQLYKMASKKVAGPNPCRDFKL